MSDNAGSIFSEVEIRIDKVQQDLNLLVSKFSAFGKKLDDISKQTGDDIATGIGDGAKKAQKSAEASAEATKKAYSNMGAAVSAIVIVAFKSIIETFAKTEQSLANVKAVTGASSEEFDKLRQAANDAGAATRFSASQAADALYALASAGFTADQSIAALQATLLLAGATQSDLGTSAETLTAIISQYGLAAEDATRVSNTLVAAIGASQATISKLANAFRSAGPVAAALGISLEETTGALEELFNAGFQGEQAGTALRNVLSSLAAETDPTVKALEALGVSFEAVNPATHSLAEIIGTLGEAGLSTGQIIGAFGRQVGPEIVTLIKQGRGALEQYTKAVTGTNAAAEQYAAQNDTLAGSFDQFTSAAENASNSLVQNLSPAIRGGLGFLQSILEVIIKLPGPIQGLIGGLLAAGAAFTLAAAGARALGFALTSAVPVIGLVVAALGGVAGGLSAIADANQKAKIKDLEGQFGGLARELGITGNGVQQFVVTAGKVDQIITTISNATRGADVSLAKLSDTVGKLSNSTGLSQEALLGVILASKNVSESIKETARVMLDQIQIETKRNELVKQGSALAQQQATDRKKNEEEAAIAATQELARRASLSAAIAYENFLVQQGLETDIEASQTKIKLRNDEIKHIEDLGAKQGKLNSDQIARVKELQSLNAGNQKTIDDAKAAQDTLDAASKQADSDEASRRAAIVELRKTDTQGILDQRDALLAQNSKDFGQTQEGARNAVAIYQDAADKIEAITKQNVANQKGIADAAAQAMVQPLKDFATLAQPIFQAVFDGLSRILTTSAANAQAEIDAQLRAQLESIDSGLQAELEAKGIQEETENQRLQREIDAASLAGDAITAKAKKDELDRLVLTQKAEKAKADATADAEKKKREASFQTAMQQWEIDLAKAISGVAIAVIQAGVITPLAIATGIAGAIQIGVIAATPPKQTFADGGIVLGNSFAGDRTIVGANAGEMILNREDQSALFDAIKGLASSPSGGSTRPIQLILDGKLVAEGVVDWINSGQVRLNI